MLRDDAFERGLQLRRHMFGPAGSDDVVDSVSELGDELESIVTRHCFGDIWQRRPLDLRDRSLATIAMVVALGRDREIEVHMRGGLANGLTVDELRELVVHTTLYCGIPAAMGAYRALARVVDSESSEVRVKPDASGRPGDTEVRESRGRQAR